MADGRITSERGWSAITHAYAKVTPYYLAHTGRIRKSIRVLSQKKR